MNVISKLLRDVNRLHDDLGTAELSRRAGLPYTTIYDASKAGFRKCTAEVLTKLADVTPQKQAS